MSDPSARAEGGEPGEPGDARAGPPESDDDADASGGVGFDERPLVVIAVSEAVVFGGFALLLANSLVGNGTFFASYPAWVRAAGACVAAFQCLAIVWVYLDVRRRPEMGAMWVHVAAMPALNVFGLVAYLAERDRKAGERAPDER